jgi:hypothetical protein
MSDFWYKDDVVETADGWKPPAEDKPFWEADEVVEQPKPAEIAGAPPQPTGLTLEETLPAAPVSKPIVPTEPVKTAGAFHPDPETGEKVWKETPLFGADDQELLPPQEKRRPLGELGAMIRESGLTPKQYAEKELLGKPEEGFMDVIAETAYKVKEMYPIIAARRWLGYSISEGKLLSQDEKLAVEYMDHYPEAEEKQQNQRLEQIMDRVDLETAAELRTAPAATTVVAPAPIRKPAVLGKPEPTEPVEAAKSLFQSYVDVMSEVPEMGRRLAGMLTIELDELAAGFGALGGTQTLLQTTKIGKKVVDVGKLEKLIAGMSRAERTKFRTWLKETRDIRAMRKAMNFAGEVGVFQVPTVVEKGRAPTGEEVGETALGFGALKVAGKAIGKTKRSLKEIKRAMQEEKPATRQIIAEADVTAEEAMRLKEAEEVVTTIKERRKTSPRQREQEEGLFLQERENQVLAERLRTEFDNTGQELTKNNFKEFWEDLTGEKISREEAGELIKNIYGAKPETLKLEEAAKKPPVETKPPAPETKVPEVETKAPKPETVPPKKRPSFEEFEKMEPAEKQRIFELNPVTQRPGTPHFERNFKERTKGETVETTAGAGDVNGFKIINDAKGMKAADDLNADIYDAGARKLGDRLSNLHGDEYSVVAKAGETVKDIVKRTQEAAKEIAKIEVEIDGKIFNPTLKWKIETPKTFDEFGKINPKDLKPNTISYYDVKKKKYISVEATKVPADRIITRDKFIKGEQGEIRLREPERAPGKKGEPTGKAPRPEDKGPGEAGVTQPEGEPKVPSEEAAVKGAVTPKESAKKKTKLISFKEFKKIHKGKEPEKAYQEFIDSQPSMVDQAGKESVQGKVQRRQAGKVGPEDQLKITEGDSPALRAQKKLEAGRKRLREKLKTKTSDLVDWFGTNIIQHEWVLAKEMLKDPLGQKAIMRFQNSRSASGSADIIAKDAKKKIKEIVPHGQEQMFEDLIQHHRTIEVDKVMKNKAERIKMKERQNELFPEETAQERIIKSPTTVAESQAYIDQVKAEYPEVYAQLEKGMNTYWDVMNKNVETLHKEGLISSGLRDYLIENHRHYSPRKFVQHLDPERITVDGGGRRVHVPDSGIKKLDRGSEDALISDWEFLLEQSVLRTQTRIFKNRANQSLLEYVKETPDNPFGFTVEKPLSMTKKGEPVFKKVPPEMTRITAMVEGKPHSILMPNEYAATWATSDPLVAQEGATFLKMATGTPLLKWMATGANPEFAITNAARDMIFTWFKQHEAFSPILPVGIAQLTGEMIKALPDVVARKGAYLKYMKNGGSMDFMTSQGFLFKPKIGELKGPMSDFGEGINNVLGYIGNTSEALTRVALMNRLLAKGKSLEEAVWTARTNLDFAQGGRITKMLDNGVPYLNASVQGTRGVFQGFKSNPKLATFKATQIMGLSFGLGYWGMKEFGEWYEGISPRERESGWIIPLPYEHKDAQGGMRYPYLKIPKDYGQRAFGAIGEAMAAQALGKEVDWDALQMSITDMFPVDASGWIPPTAGALLSYGMNKDFWRKKDIWKGRKVSPQFEFYADTPQMWVMLGDMTGLSPERLKTATGEVLPHNIYTDLMQLAWKELAGDKQEVNKTMFEQAADLPFARKVLRLTWPDRGDDLRLAKDIVKLKKAGIEIDMDRQDGTEKPKNLIKKDVKSAQMKAEDYKHLNDIELQRMMAAEFSGVIPKDNPEIKAFIEKAAKEHPTEGKRLAARYKKYKTIAVRKRQGDKDWDYLKTLLK